MVLLQGLLEPGAQAHRQGGLRQEIAGEVGTHPAQAIGGKPAGGHDAMNVGMKTQIPGPGLKHREQTQFGVFAGCGRSGDGRRGHSKMSFEPAPPERRVLGLELRP